MEAETIAGLTVLGKTAAALLFILALLAVGAWLARRLRLPQALPGRHLRVVSQTAVGARERVVVVDVGGTWLVLGVGGGQVNRLHEMPAPPHPAHSSQPRAGAG